MQIHLAKSGQKLGAFTLDEVQAKLVAGEIAETDLAWREGMAEWVPLKDIINVPPPLPPEEVKPEAVYYYIPVGRLIGMSIVTISFYQIYWFYRNWRYVKESERLDIMPVMRGIFSIFFIYSLFIRMGQNTVARTLGIAPVSEGLAVLWIILRLGTNIFGRFNTDPYLSIIVVLVGLSSVFLLVPAQRYINAINEASAPKPDFAPWKAGHTITLLLGIIIWLLMLLGFVSIFLGLNKA